MNCVDRIYTAANRVNAIRAFRSADKVCISYRSAVVCAVVAFFGCALKMYNTVSRA